MRHLSRPPTRARFARCATVRLSAGRRRRKRTSTRTSACRRSFEFVRDTSRASPVGFCSATIPRTPGHGHHGKWCDSPATCPGCLRLYFVSVFRPEVTDTRQTQSATKATWNAFQAPHQPDQHQSSAESAQAYPWPENQSITTQALQMSTVLAIPRLSHSIRNIRQSLPNCHSKDTGAPIRFI